MWFTLIPCWLSYVDIWLPVLIFHTHTLLFLVMIQVEMVQENSVSCSTSQYYFNRKLIHRIIRWHFTFDIKSVKERNHCYWETTKQGIASFCQKLASLHHTSASKARGLSKSVVCDTFKMNELIIHWFFQQTRRVVHKLAEIGNNGNFDITGFTTWKQKYSAIKCFPNEHWTWDLSHLDLLLSSLSYWGMCYLGDLRSAYDSALLVLTKWS